MCYAKDTNKNLNHGLQEKYEKSIATVNEQMFRLNNTFYYILSKLYANLLMYSKTMVDIKFFPFNIISNTNLVNVNKKMLDITVLLKSLAFVCVYSPEMVAFVHLT